MNRDYVAFNLREAQGFIASLVQQLEDGEYEESGDIAFGTNLLLIINSLNLAWHGRHMNSSEIESMSQDAYEAMAFTMPGFDHRLRIAP